MRQARARLEHRASEKEDGQQGHGEQDSGDGEGEGGEGSRPAVKGSQRINLTDPDSALMRKSKHASYEQAYNAQAVVDGEGSQLIAGCDVVQTPADANQLELAV